MATTKVKSKSKAQTPAGSATKARPVKPADETPTQKKNVAGKPKKVTEPTKEEKKSKVNADQADQPKEKPTKSKVLAPPPESDSEDEQERPSKSQTKPSSKTPSSKQLPVLLSVNANAKSSKHAKSTKSKQKVKLPSPPSSDSENAPDAEGGEEEKEEEVHLYGFSTDDDDSSDEDEDATKSAEPGLSAFEVAKLPTVAKDDESVKRRLEKAKRQTTEDRGVVYIGRLPHGFYEEQLRGYFSQFGDITRLRISRNKKTGKSKHYGFIEFDSSSVAQIVAETMDNYLLTGHILKCKLIPKDEVHPELWVGANRKWRVVPRDRVVRVQQNKPRTREQQVKANKRLIKRQNERKRKLEALGIDYEFNTVGYKKSKADAKA